MTNSRIRVAGLVLALLMITALSAGAQTATVELPLGVIVAFARECPTDGHWEPFSDAQGRVLMGAGEIVVDSETTITVVAGRPGGAAAHDHGRTGEANHHRGADDDDDDWVGADKVHTHAVQSVSALPPFIGVVFCELVK